MDSKPDGSVAMRLEGRDLARESNRATRASAVLLPRPPGLGVVLVGQDPASERYVRRKATVAERLGFVHQQLTLAEGSTQAEVHAAIDLLVGDPTIDGVLLQLPLPAGLDAALALSRIPATKDVDGLHPENLGLLAQGRARLIPCTAWGVMALLSHAGVVLRGARAVVIGRSGIVGRPVSLLLDAAGATVTVCHSHTRDLAGEVGRAEVLVVAAGVPGLVRGEWIAEGATVVDVGIHRVGEQLVGDVDAESARGRAGALTPVPGGVGPLTIAGLMRNTLRASAALQGCRLDT